MVHTRFIVDSSPSCIVCADYQRRRHRRERSTRKANRKQTIFSSKPLDVTAWIFLANKGSLRIGRILFTGIGGNSG
jgi:hypothetical protein